LEYDCSSQHLTPSESDVVILVVEMTLVDVAAQFEHHFVVLVMRFEILVWNWSQHRYPHRI